MTGAACTRNSYFARRQRLLLRIRNPRKQVQHATRQIDFARLELVKRDFLRRAYRILRLRIPQVSGTEVPSVRNAFGVHRFSARHSTSKRKAAVPKDGRAKWKQRFTSCDGRSTVPQCPNRPVQRWLAPAQHPARKRCHRRRHDPDRLGQQHA